MLHTLTLLRAYALGWYRKRVNDSRWHALEGGSFLAQGVFMCFHMQQFSLLTLLSS